ncbi:hypothetical protein [Aeromonas bivalvium]|uniref:hypothetical protein n=1 Tax=Aeromonas bivalvium TaxID=440079 RepID=UPI0005A863CA|nr:hypothetical protein [Aeromonas bivalvium]
MLSSRLPTVLIARLLLALLLACNLSLCLGWLGSHAMASPQAADHGATAMGHGEMDAAAMQVLSCHDGGGSAAADLHQDECQMHGGLTSSTGAGLPLLAALLTLLALPLLLLPPGTTGSTLDNWLRDPFLRSRGAHPPSWPRRHLMLSVLRH